MFILNVTKLFLFINIVYFKFISLDFTSLSILIYNNMFYCLFVVNNLSFLIVILSLNFYFYKTLNL